MELLDKMMDKAIEREDDGEQQMIHNAKMDLFKDLSEIRARKRSLRDKSNLLNSSKRTRVSSVIVSKTKEEGASTITTTTTPKVSRAGITGNSSAISTQSTYSPASQDNLDGPLLSQKLLEGYGNNNITIDNPVNPLEEV
jgi:hypothetical protein